jgi:CheY-like chemotaxis protein
MIGPWNHANLQPVTLEEARKKARLLVIDDHAVPFLKLFTENGYHMERWNKVENLSQLTDGHFDLILLDMHGVGLRESPQQQGLGILRHIKRSNPTQLVVAYSAQTWNPSDSEFFSLADAALDKTDEFVEFKEVVDTLLMKRYSPGHFIALMNEMLADQAILAPKAVSKAAKALRTGNTASLAKYLTSRIQEEVTVDRVLAAISIGIALLK